MLWKDHLFISDKSTNRHTKAYILLSSPLVNWWCWLKLLTGASVKGFYKNMDKLWVAVSFKKLSLFSSLLVYESSGRCKSVWASLSSMSLMYKSLSRHPRVLRVPQCKEQVINSTICGDKFSHVWGNRI